VILKSQQRVGPYEVTGVLGKGGMGEVYRARDSRLQRDVALKVLPAVFAHDPERMARFQREAQLLASLNHTNIGSLYGLEESDTVRALVLELVEGPTLADQIKRGAMLFEDARPIALQIAEAFEYAHDKGVVHRDLKPANVKVTPEGKVKVLDFGLAKALADESAGSSDPNNAPTLTMGATAVGAIMGTPAYMAPEQAKGKRVDRRADIWAFGAVLFELLTGKTLWAGDGAADIMASAMRDTPPLEHLPPETPSAIRNLIARCLDKEPQTRLQHMGEARIVLQTGGPAQRAPENRPPDVILPHDRRPWAWIAATGVCALLAAALAVVHFREPAPEQRTVRFEIRPPGKSAFQSVSLSPDGRTLAFTADGGGGIRLWVRPLDSSQAQALAGTDGASYPFWSPDGANLGFFAEGKLKRIAATGGPAQILADAVEGRGGTWSPDGVVLFAPNQGGILYRIPAAGGSASAVTKLTSPGTHRFPQFLPDSRHFLYVAEGAAPGIYVGSLEGESPVRILSEDSNAVYCPPSRLNPDGYLLFTRQGALMAQPFDVRLLRPYGEALLVTGDAVYGAASYVPFSASASGSVAYALGIAKRQLVWRDRTGKQLGLVAKPDGISFESLSPDEKRVVFATGRVGSSTGLWLYDVARQTVEKFTFSAGISQSPVWSPDGSHIVFATSAEPGQQMLDIVVKPASGGAKAELLQRSVGYVRVNDWSADGKLVVYMPDTNSGKPDIWLLPLEGDHKPIPYLQNEFAKYHGQLSHDGKWMAYTSAESGQEQVFVQAVPATNARWLVSPKGGSRPRWRRDGTELFYVAADRTVMAVPVKTGAKFEAGTPKPLFGPLRPVAGTPYQFYYQPTADGQRFLVNEPAEEEGGAQPVTVVLNWQAGLKK
jgi:serine/threonine protein kinase/Tol biopolymer transport system component